METPLQITFKGLESSPSVEALIRKRAAALERAHPRIVSCRVVVDVPHRSTESVKVPLEIAVEVGVPGRKTVFAKDATERHEMKTDYMAAINNAFEAVERQLTKITDVQSRDVKQHAATGESGVIVGLFPQQNYGFIEIKGSPDLYFTRYAVIGSDFDDLEVGMLVHVTRAMTEGPMGPQASSVRVRGARSPS